MIIISRNFILSVIIILLLSGCSKTLITSNPEQARVYIDGKYKGETPYKYRDAKIIFSKTKIRLAKDGYNPLDTVIVRNGKPAFGAIAVQTYLILSSIYIPVPLLWVMGYAPKHHYAMVPNQEFKLTDTVKTIKPKTLHYDYTIPSLRFAVNPTEPLMNDYSLFIDYVTKNKKSFGISAGYMIGNKWWTKSGFEVDDDIFPVGVYNGFVGRVYYKWYFIKNKVRYLSPSFLFKDLHYDRTRFGDKITPYEWVTFERSEKARVLGLQVLYGKENYLTKNIFIDFYYGLGARIRLREYSTFKVWPEGAKQVMPLGNFTSSQVFPTIHLGVKVGFGFLLNNKN